MKTSSFMLIIIGLFLLMDFFAYRSLHHYILLNHQKNTKILFLNITSNTNNLLSKLLYEYSKQKEILIEKHKIVLDYLVKQKSQDILKLDLEQIAKQLNNNIENTPYNIYITDKNYVIKNSTYKKDIGFDLSFAKNTFDKHFKNGEIVACTPIFEKTAKNFFTFTDSYIVKDGSKEGILQVSYNYPKVKEELNQIKKLITKYPNIEDAKAYILVNTGFINDLILKDFSSYKPTLQEIENRIKDGQKIKEKLKDSNIYQNTFEKEGKTYKLIYFSTKSSIFDDTKIIYSIVLDESILLNNIAILNISMIVVTLLSVLGIIIVTFIRNKERRLFYQDKFVQSSMHEIKTPLSIITLNNELRQLEFGKDEYSSEIDGALKILENSYNDMNFLAIKKDIKYTTERVNLKDLVLQRVDYFKTIADSNEKKLELTYEGSCQIEISKIEIIRLIDNNLSNAIKYSKRESKIEIIVDNNLLKFKNIGIPIKNNSKVFHKYYRENNVIGGHGLGLSIVNDICKKYHIGITLSSDEENGTIFEYKFKCHTNDTSM